MKKTTKTKGFIMLTVAAVMLVMLTLCFLACRYTMKAETHVRYGYYGCGIGEDCQNHQWYGDECDERFR